LGVGAGLYMYDVVVKSSRSLCHLLMSSCFVYIFVYLSIYLSIYLSRPIYPFFTTPTGHIFSAISTLSGSYDVFLQLLVPFGVAI